MTKILIFYQIFYLEKLIENKTKKNEMEWKRKDFSQIPPHFSIQAHIQRETQREKTMTWSSSSSWKELFLPYLHHRNHMDASRSFSKSPRKEIAEASGSFLKSPRRGIAEEEEREVGGWVQDGRWTRATLNRIAKINAMTILPFLIHFICKIPRICWRHIPAVPWFWEILVRLGEIFNN